LVAVLTFVNNFNHAGEDARRWMVSVNVALSVNVKVRLVRTSLDNGLQVLWGA